LASPVLGLCTLSLYPRSMHQHPVPS